MPRPITKEELIEVANHKYEKIWIAMNEMDERQQRSNFTSDTQ